VRRRNLSLRSAPPPSPAGRWARLRSRPGRLRLGIVALTPRSAPNWVGFEQRLKEFGYIDGQSLAIEFIDARNSGGIDAAMKSWPERASTSSSRPATSSRRRLRLRPPRLFRSS